MAFANLMAAAERGELILIDGGYCLWHLRRDGQLTISEILATRKGAGSEMLARLRAVKGAHRILAKCPVGYASNSWYERKGFRLSAVERSRTGTRLNVWVLRLI